MTSAIVAMAILWGAIAALIASRRGANSAPWFAAGFFLGPIGIVWALTTGKSCPHCHSKIHQEAQTCPKCGQPVPVVPKQAAHLQHAPEQPIPDQFIPFVIVFIAIFAIALAYISLR